MNGAQECRQKPNSPEAVKDERQSETRRAANRHAEHGEGNGPDDAPNFNCREGRRKRSGEQPLELGGGIERGDGEVGENKRGEREGQKEKAGRAVAEARSRGYCAHTSSPSK